MEYIEFIIDIDNKELHNNVKGVKHLMDKVSFNIIGNFGVITVGKPIINDLKVYQLPSFIALSLNVDNPAFTMPIISTDILDDIIYSAASSFGINTLMAVKCERKQWMIRLYYFESRVLDMSYKPGLFDTGYIFGSEILKKSDVLSNKEISKENQNLIWPDDEGFPYISKFKDEIEIRKSLKKIIDEIACKHTGKGIIFFSYNGYQAENNTFSTFNELISDSENLNIDVVDFEASCFGSLYALKLMQHLINDEKYDYGAYICISDRARHFNNETKLFSLNYADAIGFAVVSNKYRFHIGKLNSISSTKMLLKDFPEEVGNRESLLLKKRLSKLESENIIKIVSFNDKKFGRFGYIIPRVSPSSNELVTRSKKFELATSLKNENWPTGIFSGISWIIDMGGGEELNSYDQISISTIGYGFTWASILFERP
ncbi:hypothetical protein [Photorhabdus laumondii]